MSKNLNAQLRDAALAHLIDLQRYANSEVQAMLTTLRKSDVVLFARLSEALANVDATNFTVKRLESALASVWSANEDAYRQIATDSLAELRDLTAFELDHQEYLFKDLLPGTADLSVAVPVADDVWAATTARPFQGRLLSDWFDSLAASRQVRIADTIAGGFVRGETVGEMVSALRGTKANNYADGILQIDARNAEAVVRTAVAGTASQARSAFYAENADLIESEQWVSTLDSRTTEACQIRDGLLYTVEDHEPIDHDVPWDEGPGEIHWNCRSVSVPVVAAASTLGLDLPPAERASMDGEVPASTTFGEWIAEQSASVQDSALGATRGAALRSGAASFTSFFSNKGDLLSLAELRGKIA